MRNRFVNRKISNVLVCWTSDPGALLAGKICKNCHIFSIFFPQFKAVNQRPLWNLGEDAQIFIFPTQLHSNHYNMDNYRSSKFFHLTFILNNVPTRSDKQLSDKSIFSIEVIYITFFENVFVCLFAQFTFKKVYNRVDYFPKNLCSAVFICLKKVIVYQKYFKYFLNSSLFLLMSFY